MPWASRAQGEGDHLLECRHVTFEVESRVVGSSVDRPAEVLMKTGELEARVVDGERGRRQSVVLVHAELRPAQCSANSGSSAAKGRSSSARRIQMRTADAPSGPHAGERLKLLERVDVHVGHPVLGGPAQLVEGLRVAVEDEGRRRHAGRQRQLDVAHRHDVDQRTLLPGDPNDRGLGVGLGRVDEAASLVLGYGTREQRAVVVADRSLGDDPERGSVLAGEVERIAAVDLEVAGVVRAHERAEPAGLQRHRRSLRRP